MKKALIFGITGQDGSYLTENLLSKDYRVTGVARRVSVDTTSRISHVMHNIKMAEGDITDQFCVSNIIHTEQPDEIYNLAAQSHVGTSFKQPTATWAITAGGCLNILEAIRSLDLMDRVRFYQASSSEMFGRNYDMRNYSIYNISGRNSILKYQDEETSFKPQSPYAIAKLAAHYAVDNYRESYGLFGCSGILFNHESERRGEKFVTRKITKWIGGFVKAGKPSDYPKLRLGNLDSRRDWGHAEDYVEAMWRMLQREKPGDYVISTGETHSIREFLHVAFKEVGIDDWGDYVVVDPEFYRPADVDYLLGLPSKAKYELGWEPKISFKALVKRMVAHDCKT